MSHRHLSLHKRPTIIEEKRRIGDFEGDTVVGAKQSGYLVTYTGRKSKFLIMGRSDSKIANEISKVTRNTFSEIETIHSITLDNGAEFSEFENMEEFLNCKIYFTDKSSPWQRGLNEYTNRLIRQYLPKKTSLKNIKQKDLDLIAYLY